MKRTFQHRFRGGVVATMTIDPDFTPGTTHIISCEWNRKPKPSVLPEYTRWVHTINELIAAETGKKILHIFMLSGIALNPGCTSRTNQHGECTYPR